MPNESAPEPTPPSDPALPVLAIRALTLLAAELAFVGLFVYFVVATWQASGSAPSFSAVQVSAGSALAVALGGGYALFLGVEPKGAALQEWNTLRTEGFWTRFWKFLQYLFTIRPVLVLGVLTYFAVCVTICITYAFNEAETPGVLRTVAVAFGGYVIAYIGTAFRQYFPA
jgi:hypothetical protein